MPLAELCREHGVVLQVAGEIWRDALSGFCFAKPCRVTDASLIARTKALEDENRLLKKMFAELNRPGFAGGWFVQRLSDHIE